MPLADSIGNSAAAEEERQRRLRQQRRNYAQHKASPAANISAHSSRVPYRLPPKPNMPGTLYRTPSYQMPNFSLPAAAPAAVGTGGSLVKTNPVAFLRGLQGVISPIEGMGLNDMLGDFGPRIHPVHGRSSFHTGVDLAAPMGTPIMAAANGYVEEVNFGDSAYGNQLVLKHGRNKETMYGHLSQFESSIAPGTKVRKGDVIGFVGSTGLSTGPHLHWETWVNGQAVNPLTFMGGN